MRSQAVGPQAAQLSRWLHRPAPFCKRLHHITHRQEHLGDSGLRTHHAASVPQVGELLFHPVAQLNPPPQERHLGQSSVHQPQLSLRLPAPSHVVCHNTVSLEP